jgi:hypothetical protein
MNTPEPKPKRSLWLAIATFFARCALCQAGWKLVEGRWEKTRVEDGRTIKTRTWEADAVRRIMEEAI